MSHINYNGQQRHSRPQSDQYNHRNPYNHSNNYLNNPNYNRNSGSFNNNNSGNFNNRNSRNCNNNNSGNFNNNNSSGNFRQTLTTSNSSRNVPGQENINSTHNNPDLMVVNTNSLETDYSNFQTPTSQRESSITSKLPYNNIIKSLRVSIRLLIDTGAKMSIINPALCR